MRSNAGESSTEQRLFDCSLGCWCRSGPQICTFTCPGPLSRPSVSESNVGSDGSKELRTTS